MQHVLNEKSIIRIAGEINTGEVYHKINCKTVTIYLIGNEFNYPFALMQGFKFTIQLPFSKESSATFIKFESYSNDKEPAKVTLTFELE